MPHFASGGMQTPSSEMPFFIRQEAYDLYRQPMSGFLHSTVPGRTDRLPIPVATDSYVIPADVVSGLGQGNSLAGARVLEQALHIGPYGTDLPRTRGSLHVPVARPPKPAMARGGAAEGDDGHVPILAAGGEYVVHPEDVRRIGGGSVSRGHKRLDDLVKNVRTHVRKRLAELPPPKH